MNPRYRNPGIALCILLGGALFAVCREPSPPIATSPQENAFLSYWQCADNLAKGLLEIESHEDLIKPREAIGPPDLMATRPMKNIFDDLCKDLETHKAAAEQVPTPMNELLLLEHADLVNAVKAAVRSLEHRNAKSPEILGEDWNRYRQSFAVGGADS